MALAYYKKSTFEYNEEFLDIKTLNAINDRDAQLVLEHTTQLLANRGVKTYLAFGTLLGAIRDKDFISGDLDVDIYTDNEKGLFENLSYLEAQGLKLIRFIAGKTYSFRLNKGCYIDIYILKNFTLSPWALYCVQLNGAYMPRKLFKSEETIEFRGNKYLCVKNPIRLLKFWYGETWNTPIGKSDKEYKYRVSSHYYYLKMILSFKQLMRRLVGEDFYKKLKYIIYHR